MDKSHAVRPLRLPHVRSLDGVRGLAAVAVVLHHTLGVGNRVPPGHFSAGVHAVCSYLYLGVDLFFVLSGYLITTLLLIARRHGGYYRNFYWKRVFRILPALFLVLAIAGIVFHQAASGILAAVFFIANYAFVLGIPDIGPFWTLAIEEQFYLVWPSFVRRIHPRKLLYLLVGVIAGCELIRFVSEVHHHGRIGSQLFHFDGLAWGAVIGLLSFRWRIPFRPGNPLRLWRRVYRYPLACFVVFLLLAIAARFHQGFLYDFITTAASSLFALLILYLLTHNRGLLSRGLALRPIRFLGDISYMLYLSHAYWISLIDRWSPVLLPAGLLQPGNTGLYLRAALCLLVSILWSAASLYLFERPIGRLRRYFLHHAGPAKNTPSRHSHPA